MNNGDIWLINLDPSIGAEIRKTRPAIIASSDAVGIFPLKVVIPVTDWKTHYSDVPWIVKLLPDKTNVCTKCYFRIVPGKIAKYIDSIIDPIFEFESKQEEKILPSPHTGIQFPPFERDVFY